MRKSLYPTFVYLFGYTGVSDRYNCLREHVSLYHFFKQLGLAPILLLIKVGEYAPRMGQRGCALVLCSITCEGPFPCCLAAPPLYVLSHLQLPHMPGFGMAKGINSVNAKCGSKTGLASSAPGNIGRNTITTIQITGSSV